MSGTTKSDVSVNVQFFYDTNACIRERTQQAAPSDAGEVIFRTISQSTSVTGLPNDFASFSIDLQGPRLWHLLYFVKLCIVDTRFGKYSHLSVNITQRSCGRLMRRKHRLDDYYSKTLTFIAKSDEICWTVFLFFSSTHLALFSHSIARALLSLISQNIYNVHSYFRSTDRAWSHAYAPRFPKHPSCKLAWKKCYTICDTCSNYLRTRCIGPCLVCPSWELLYIAIELCYLACRDLPSTSKICQLLLLLFESFYRCANNVAFQTEFCDMMKFRCFCYGY